MYQAAVLGRVPHVSSSLSVVILHELLELDSMCMGSISPEDDAFAKDEFPQAGLEAGTRSGHLTDSTCARYSCCPCAGEPKHADQHGPISLWQLLVQVVLVAGAPLGEFN